MLHAAHGYGLPVPFLQPLSAQRSILDSASPIAPEIVFCHSSDIICDNRPLRDIPQSFVFVGRFVIFKRMMQLSRVIYVYDMICVFPGQPCLM